MYYGNKGHSSSQNLEIKPKNHLETATQILLLLTLNMSFNFHLLRHFADLLISFHLPVVNGVSQVTESAYFTCCLVPNSTDITFHGCTLNKNKILNYFCFYLFGDSEKKYTNLYVFLYFFASD